MDAVEEAADFVQVYAVRGPTDQAVTLASFLRQVTEELLGCINGISEGEDISGHVHAIARTENEADKVYRAALGALISFGEDRLHAIRWKDVYDRLEEAIDRCEEVAQFLGHASASSKAG